MSLSRTTLPPIAFGTGGGLAPGVESLPAIETRLLFVDKGTNAAPDGSRQEPFHTIAAALAQAAVLAPTAVSRVCILIYPGEYAEDGLNSVDYVDMIGVGPRGAVRIEGAAATTYTVDNEHTTHRNITLANTGAFGIVTVTGAMATSALFVECAFEGSASDLSRVDINGGADAEFHDCRFANAGVLRAVQTAGVGSVIVLRRCVVSGTCRFDDASVTVEGSTFAQAVTCTTLARLELRCSTFVSDTSCVTLYATPSPGIIHDNRFVAGAGSYDITADAARAGLSIEGNIMTRGMHGYISHVKPERNVGAAGNLDFYPTLQFALDSCTFDDITVKLLRDISLTAAATFTGFTVKIDGNGLHTVTDTIGGGAFFVAGAFANRWITFYDLIIVGAVVLVPGAGANQKVIFDRMIGAPIGIAMNPVPAGYEIIMRHSVLTSGGGLNYVMYFNQDIIVTIDHCRLKGDTGFPALFWLGTTANPYLRIKHSTIWHGSGAANDPFGRGAGQVVTFKSHHSEYNSIPGSGWATNVIPAGQTQDGVDVNTDY